MVVWRFLVGAVKDTSGWAGHILHLTQTEQPFGINSMKHVYLTNMHLEWRINKKKKYDFHKEITR